MTILYVVQDGHFIFTEEDLSHESISVLEPLHKEFNLCNGWLGIFNILLSQLLFKFRQICLLFYNRVCNNISRLALLQSLNQVLSGLFIFLDRSRCRIVVLLSLLRHSYCGNNPVNITDPTGHWGEFINRYDYLKVAKQLKEQQRAREGKEKFNNSYCFTFYR